MQSYITERDKCRMENIAGQMAGLHKDLADIISELGDLKIPPCANKCEVDIMVIK